jgi:hypothetical protein
MHSTIGSPTRPINGVNSGSSRKRSTPHRTAATAAATVPSLSSSRAQLSMSLSASLCPDDNVEGGACDRISRVVQQMPHINAHYLGTSSHQTHEHEGAARQAPFLCSFSGLLSEAEIYQQYDVASAAVDRSVTSSMSQQQQRLQRWNSSRDAGATRRTLQAQPRRVVAIASSLPRRDDVSFDQSDNQHAVYNGTPLHHQPRQSKILERAAASSILRPQSSPYRTLGIVRPDSGSVRVGVSSPTASHQRRPATASAMLACSIHTTSVALSQERPPSALVHDARVALLSASKQRGVSSAASLRVKSCTRRSCRPSSSTTSSLGNLQSGSKRSSSMLAGDASGYNCLPPRPSTSSTSFRSNSSLRHSLDLLAPTGSLPALVRQALQSS